MPTPHLPVATPSNPDPFVFDEFVTLSLLAKHSSALATPPLSSTSSPPSSLGNSHSSLTFPSSSSLNPSASAASHLIDPTSASHLTSWSNPFAPFAAFPESPQVQLISPVASTRLPSSFKNWAAPSSPPQPSFNTWAALSKPPPTLHVFADPFAPLLDKTAGAPPVSQSILAQEALALAPSLSTVSQPLLLPVLKPRAASLPSVTGKLSREELRALSDQLLAPILSPYEDGIGEWSRGSSSLGAMIEVESSQSWNGGAAPVQHVPSLPPGNLDDLDPFAVTKSPPQLQPSPRAQSESPNQGGGSNSKSHWRSRCTADGEALWLRKGMKGRQKVHAQDESEQWGIDPHRPPETRSCLRAQSSVQTTRNVAPIGRNISRLENGNPVTLSARIKAFAKASGYNSDSEADNDDDECAANSATYDDERATTVLRAPVPRVLPPDDAGMCGSNPFDISSFNDSSSREQPSDANPSWTATPTPSYSATSQHTSAELVVVPDDSCGTLPVPPSPNHSQGKRRITFVPQSSVQALVHRHQSNMATATELKDETSWYTIGLKLSGKGSAYTRYTSQPSPRLNIPASDQGGDYYLLQQGIMRSWEKAEPTEAQKKSIRQLRDTLTDLLNQRTLLDNPTGKRYIVDVFGSVAWGGSTGSSGDVDLVIIDTNLPLGYDPTLWKEPPTHRLLNGGRTSRKNDKVPNIYNMHWLKVVLRSVDGVTEAKAIASAPTPIVKFNVPGKGLQCDICTNDLGGWYNSALILAYCELSPFVLRPMIHVLKLWLASHDLNDPAGRHGRRSMSSYCLTLMAVAYLQHIDVLPNLQENVQVPASADPTNRRLTSTIWLSWGRKQGEMAHISFDRRAPEGWTSAAPGITAAEAVKGFFKYFSGLGNRTFRPTTQIVSVLNGGISNRRNPPAQMGSWRSDAFPGNDYVGKCNTWQPTHWDDQRLIVQDPFLWQKNCAKTMWYPEGDQEKLFFDRIARTHRVLETTRNPAMERIMGPH